ncbi:hypothetical protein BDV38DRAFT_238339 [Aspergillus pseudotamarii]|uniref:Uncharacterized protein n=1 Tax=Aspergillus pseudotamarii TaxID=132259 RepID=A0A5N6T3U1_ASPPS|nr:uncharacterized protein BDV38DRAFT_238339 [Aspergillus pseudotamarii]KAE8140973.1 hypothetical protein BDV38DRAFT_238339 [Aspergillus pseudotamarii]
MEKGTSDILSRHGDLVVDFMHLSFLCLFFPFPFDLTSMMTTFEYPILIVGIKPRSKNNT